MTPQEIATKYAWGTPAHRKLCDSLKARLRLSEQRYRETWAQQSKNEELFQSYIPEKDVDALRRVRRETYGEVHYRTVEIPYSYAVVMTAHTYYTSVFLARNPIFQLSGRHGEAENKRVAMESLLAYQMQVGELLAPLFCWLLDPGKYGYSVLGTYWALDSVVTRRFETQPVSFLGTPIPDKFQTVEVADEQVNYEGNRAFNIRPQDFFPDPRVALVQFQRGEFAGRYVETPWHEIAQGQSTGRYFNYPALMRARLARDTGDSEGIVTRDTGSDAVSELPNTNLEEIAGFDIPVGIVKGYELGVRLVPSEWGLGDSDRHEIWMFNLSTNGIIFGVVPLGERHGKFPYDILVDEIDGYTVFPRATLERVKPLNDVLSWLINSHFYNVRQTLNNQFIVDPSMVVMKDVENPSPGKAIRLKPEAFGKDVRTAISQLQVMDITRTHLGDANMMSEFIQRVTGVNDPIMGAVNAGGRKTATEVRTSTTFGINRLKTMCEWHSTIGFAPLSQKLVQRTQQLFSVPRQYRIVGDQAQFSPQFAMVTPEDITGYYDFEHVDGTLPVDRFAQANLWQMLLGQVGQMPAILMQYDLAKIFAWVAQLAGIKNIAQFRVVSDEQALLQMQAGNVVPIGKARSETNPNEPRQIPGMGPTG